MISVVICTYNRHERLEQTIKSFFAQRHLELVEHELLVIDNNSTDRTRDTVARLHTAHPLRYVFEPRQGLCAARNRGVSDSNGDFVALLDDDVVLDSEWLCRLERAFRETDADVVGGRSYLIFEGPLPAWFGPDFRPMLSEVELGGSRAVVPEGRGLAGLNLAFRKRVLAAVGPFDETIDRRGRELLGGGETLIMRKIQAAGGVILYDPDIVVGHIIGPDRLEWDYFVRLSAGIGKSMAMWDRRDTLAGRLGAVLRSTVSLGLAVATVAARVLKRASPYDRRCAVRRMMVRRSRLMTECSQIWRVR